METQTATPRSGMPSPRVWVGPVILAAILAVFFFFVPGFGGNQDQSPLAWLETTWNAENDYEHGFLIPIIMVGLLAWQWRTLRESVTGADWRGLPVVIVGILFFIVAHRAGQARLAVGGLPMILWGSAWYLYGWQIARLTFFPFFVFWLAIPVPQFQQATTHLQILSTKLAQVGCGLFGVETFVHGTKIHSVTNQWEPLQIDEGCGGIRSLMALILISCVWAYVAKMALWKKALLCLAAFPLAILGNMLRLTSIFVIAEYGSSEFASKTWHDWSGLLLFYPISLILLFLTHSILEGGMPKIRRRRQARRVVSRQVEAN